MTDLRPDDTPGQGLGTPPHGVVDISIVVPTYNENANIVILVDRLAAALSGRRFEVIVVDDDSPDRTWETVDALRQTRPWLSCVRRLTKRGLSSAVLDGLVLARGEALAVIDADLQHDPAVLPALIDGLATSEVVVASRYTAGGSMGEWSWIRRIISRVAGGIVHIVLGAKTTDPMSGYFALRRSLVQRVAPLIRPRGYKILIELIYRGQVRQVGEVAYEFGVRMHGQSKLTSAVMWDFLASMWDLRFGAIMTRRFIEYCLVGTSGVVVQLLVTHLLLLLPALRFVDSGIPISVGIICAMIWNYFLNNLWSFADARLRSRASWWSGLTRFCMICGTGAIINFWVVKGVLRLSDHRIGLTISMLIGIVAATFWNYALNRRFTWHAKR